MKVTPRNMVRAALVLAAAGVIGAFGACSDNGVSPPPPPPVPPPPPPPPTLQAPKNLSATANSATQITLNWQDSTATETGFRIDRCTGPACANFAKLVDVAANAVTFADTGLTASTQYSYRARAFTATDTSAWTATVNATTLGVVQTPGIVMVGAGEITSCGIGQAGATALLVDKVLETNPDAIVFTAGNNLNAAPGASTSYTTCFDPNWGKFKDRMRVAVGQADFASTSTQAVYSYFGERAGADSGWYSFDAGDNWHVIVLNTTTWQHGKCNMGVTDPDCAGQPARMFDWLRADLTANTKKCIAVISWERRFYVGDDATFMNSNMRSITHVLTDFGADVVISAKDKVYARFAPQTYLGVADPGGIRQFIVGTGGRSLDNLGATAPPTLEASSDEANGVLKLTLNADSYDWEFVPTVPGGFTDTGTTACH